MAGSAELAKTGSFVLPTLPNGEAVLRRSGVVDPQRSADIQIANHAGEISTPIPQASEAIEVFHTRITEKQKRRALFSSIQDQFKDQKAHIVEAIYRVAREEMDREPSEPSVITEIPNPTLQDRLEAARNSGTTGSGRVFVVKPTPKPISF